MNIGPFLRELDLKSKNMKEEIFIIRERLAKTESEFSLKVFLLQIAIGILGIVIMFALDPIVRNFQEGGGNSPIAFWGYIVSGIFVVIGAFAVFDLIKKILKF